MKDETAQLLKNAVLKYLQDPTAFQHTKGIQECAVALLWAEITRTRYVNLKISNLESRLFSPVDAREKLSPSLHKSYFGNMSFTAVATRTASQLISLRCHSGHLTEDRSAFIAQVATAAVAYFQSIKSLNNDEIRRRLTLLHQLRRPIDAHETFHEAARSCMTGIRLLYSHDIEAFPDFGIPGAGRCGIDKAPRCIRKPWLYDVNTICLMPKQWLPGLGFC